MIYLFDINRVNESNVHITQETRDLMTSIIVFYITDPFTAIIFLFIRMAAARIILYFNYSCARGPCHFVPFGRLERTYQI